MSDNIKYEPSPSGGYYITVGGNKKTEEYCRLQLKPDAFVYSVVDTSKANDDPIVFLMIHAFSNSFIVYAKINESKNIAKLNFSDIFFDPNKTTDIGYKLLVFFLYLASNGVPKELSDNFVTERKRALPSVSYSDFEIGKFKTEDVYNLYAKYITVDKWKLKTSIEYNKSNPTVVERVNILKSLTTPSETAFTYFDPNGAPPALPPTPTPAPSSTTTTTDNNTTTETVPTTTTASPAASLFIFLIIIFFLFTFGGNVTQGGYYYRNGKRYYTPPLAQGFVQSVVPGLVIGPAQPQRQVQQQTQMNIPAPPIARLLHFGNSSNTEKILKIIGVIIAVFVVFFVIVNYIVPVIQRYLACRNMQPKLNDNQVKLKVYETTCGGFMGIGVTDDEIVTLQGNISDVYIPKDALVIISTQEDLEIEKKSNGSEKIGEKIDTKNATEITVRKLDKTKIYRFIVRRSA